MLTIHQLAVTCIHLCFHHIHYPASQADSVAEMELGQNFDW